MYTMMQNGVKHKTVFQEYGAGPGGSQLNTIRVNFGGLEYKNAVPEAIMNNEGRYIVEYFSPDSIAGVYEYNLKDHLGNTRVVFADVNDNGVIDTDADSNEVRQVLDYYPFGMEMHNDPTPLASQSTDPENRYTYNGKENHSEIGLGWLDYGARWYDPTIGRFSSVDPLANEFSMWSTYVIGFTNPIRYIDPDGRASKPVNDILVKQTKDEKETSAESTWLVYPTGTFDNTSLTDLQEMSVTEIIDTYGEPEATRIGSSLPDNPASEENPDGNATITEGRYTYEKGSFTRIENVLHLSEGRGQGNVSTIFPNKKHGGKNIATEVAGHAGKKEWQTPLLNGKEPNANKGSSGCPTCVRFGSMFRNLDNTGNFLIVRQNDKSE